MASAPESVTSSIEPRVQSPDHRAHVVQFYSKETFLLDELSKFIGTALISGDAAIVIATSAHRAGLAKRLAARNLDLSRTMQSGRYLAIDALETLERFMVDGQPDLERFRQYIASLVDQAQMAGEGNSPRIVVFGEMVSILWAQGNPQAAIGLEQLWNEVIQSRPLHLRCGYPISHFNRQDHADAFLEICAQHTAVIPGESYTTLSTEEDRLRSISQLQQKAQALETEVTERKRTQDAFVLSQDALRKSHEDLEMRVAARTQELANAENRLGELSRKLLNLRDEERRRLARELHDSTGQTLAALALNLVMLQQESLPQPVADKLSESTHLADQALHEIRTISYLLHPPMLDEAGLVLALEWYVEGLTQRSRLKIDLDLPGQYERLPQEMELAIFRIVQEALTNVYRHSGSNSAKVKLRIDPDQVHLSIQDSGKGIPREYLEASSARTIGVGIRGMQERAKHLEGKLELSSQTPGTCVTVTLPIRRNKQTLQDI